MQKLIPLLALVLLPLGCSYESSSTSTEVSDDMARDASLLGDLAYSAEADPAAPIETGAVTELAPISPQDSAWIGEQIAQAEEFVNAYKPDTEELTAETLDEAITAWKADPDQTDLSPEEVKDAVGVAMGQVLVDDLGLDWFVVDTELIVAEPEKKIAAKPLVLAEAVVADAGPDLSLKRAYDGMKRTIEMSAQSQPNVIQDVQPMMEERELPPALPPQ